MTEPIKKARKAYENKRIVKPISFNQHTESDLIKFAESVEFSTWVKDRIKEALDINNDY